LIKHDDGALLPVTQVNSTHAQIAPTDVQVGDDGIDLLDLLTILAARWRLLVVAPIAAGAFALGATYLIAPTYTAKTSFLPPQQQQSSAASALASLGALSGLVGGAAGIKSPGDQYVALMQSVNVEDRIVDQFKLMEVYEAKYRFEARKKLEENVRIALGKKDGLITVEADAASPQLAADLANQFVVELRRLSSELALTEAQQRRVFFENQLKRTKIQLAAAQTILQGSGFNAGALKAEPKAAAEGYARLKAEVTSAEVRLQTLRRALADSAPELQQQLGLLAALRAQLAKLESSVNNPTDSDYVSRYREYKYQESLFELFSRQYEVARLDESREGALIQVVDVAAPPEYKSKPKRASTALMSAFATLLILLIGVPAYQYWREARKDPTKAEKFGRLGAALDRR
jgi:uncharacterized protein involved in exopolysaccharide biosynthesis